MPALLESPPREKATPRSRPASWGRWWRAGVVALALTIVAHGCHGDEDHELFARLVRSLATYCVGD
ncbi:MAG: hypothetical protein K2X38_14175 [Gemmataceae bacterium]|nr:hypothetical protein [Gemmataceae bacterium]